MAVAESFVVMEKSLGRQASGGRQPHKPYLRLTLSDRTGQVKAIMWEGAQKASTLFGPGDVLWVEGRVTLYGGQLQVEVDSLRPLTPEEVDRSQLFPQSSREVGEMEEELEGLIASISQPDLAGLLASLFERDDFRRSFLESTCAVSVHHAYAGGLLEHSLEVARIALWVSGLHPHLACRDLVLAGALLHDLGKLEAYTVRGMSYDRTTDGKLFGHVLLGYQRLRDILAQREDFPPDLSRELLHIMASHHGQREYGALERPATFNAFAVHWADMTSTRVFQYAAMVRQGLDLGQEWTPRHPYLGVEAYLGFLPPGGNQEEDSSGGVPVDE